MDTVEATHRAHVGLVIALVMLGLTGVQIWAGKTPTAFSGFPPKWTRRKTEPFWFWFAMIAWTMSGLYIMGYALSRLVRLHALPF